MIKIGLTGNMTTGKTLALTKLKSLGVKTLDLDEYSKKICQSAEIKDLLQERFSYHVFYPNGQVNLSKLQQIIASDDYYRFWWHKLLVNQLNSFLPLWIFGQQKQGVPLVVVAFALIIEANWQHHFDEVWLIYSTKQAILERVQAREKIDLELASQLLATQMSDQKKRPLVQAIINNYGTIPQLEEAVEDFLTTHFGDKNYAC